MQNKYLKNYNSRNDYKAKAKREKRIHFLMLYLMLFLILAFVIVLFFFMQRNVKKNSDTPDTSLSSQTSQTENKSSAKEVSKPVSSSLSDAKFRTQLINQADQLAVGYDYEAAISLLKKNQGYEQYQDVLSKVTELENIKSTLVPVDMSQIPHFFTHPLVYDAKIGFKSDMSNGYQQESLTVDEFNSFLEQMYKNGYVIVNIHDLATSYTDKNGRKKLKRNKIMLPEGKKAFIFSEDDTNYYQRWQQKGVGSRLVVGANGKVTCEVDLKDGTKIQGDYDVLPCLETFIQNHPDFSYKGARASIGVTGIEGVLGYRTSKYRLGEWNKSSVNSEKEFDVNSEDSKKAIAVSQAIRNQGFDLVSHSFVHGAYSTGGTYCSNSFLKYDIRRFETEIEPLIGKTDTILYPNGADIEHGEDAWKYKLSNPRFNKLYKSGLQYYFNVDTNDSTPWETYGSNYVRGRRVGLIGYTVLCKADYLKKTFNISVKKMIDQYRPTPRSLDYYGTKVPVNAKKY